MDESDLQRVRAIPLEAVLERFGARRARNDPKRNWKCEASRITVRGALFYDHVREAGGCGAIDLACHLGGWGFREALAWLGGDSALIEQARPMVSPSSEESRSLPPPIPDPSQLSRVRRYLTRERAIPKGIVERLIDKGQLFADAKGNAVFVLRDEALKAVGYELRGTSGKPFHCVAGERKGLFFARLSKDKVATFVESGIEALSYLALHPKRLAISTTGNAVELPEVMGGRLLDLGYRLYAGFNANREGDRMSQRLTERLGGRMLRDRPDE